MWIPLSCTEDRRHFGQGVHDGAELLSTAIPLKLQQWRTSAREGKRLPPWLWPLQAHQQLSHHWHEQTWPGETWVTCLVPQAELRWSLQVNSSSSGIQFQSLSTHCRNGSCSQFWSYVHSTGPSSSQQRQDSSILGCSTPMGFQAKSLKWW